MKTAVVFGASGGIGKACVKALLEKGWNVYAGFNTNPRELEEIKNGIYRDNLVSFQCDISSLNETRKIFDAVNSKFGSVEAVINCSGISMRGLIQDLTPEELSLLIDTNIKGSYNVCRCAVESMLKNHRGSIVNMSSMWGETGASFEVAYSMTKAAVIGLTKALAKEVGPSGIRVNCISPGLIETPMNREIDEESKKIICEETPLMRIGTPLDVANTAVFLSEDTSSFITGQIIGVNGGYVI